MRLFAPIRAISPVMSSPYLNAATRPLQMIQGAPLAPLASSRILGVANLAKSGVVGIARLFAKRLPGPSLIPGNGAAGGSGGSGSGGFWFVLIIGGLTLLAACSGDEDEGSGIDSCAECHTSPHDPPSLPFHMYGDPEEKGSHNDHLNTNMTTSIPCSRCHPVPTEPGRTETHRNRHVDVYSEQGDWIRQYSDNSCLSYCHNKGEPQIESPMPWKDYTGDGLDCNSCHPKTEPAHDITDRKECFKCHDETMAPNGEFESLAKHLDYNVEVRADLCTPCHGNPPPDHIAALEESLAAGEETEDEIAAKIALIEDCSNCHPTKPTSGFRTSPDDPHRDGVTSLKEDRCTSSCHQYPPTDNSHISHAVAPSFALPYLCADCHEMDNDDFNHLPYPKVVVAAKWRKVNYEYDPNSGKCSGTNCHDREGKLTEPEWSDTSGAPKECDSCHGDPPPSPIHNVEPAPVCGDCHRDPRDDPQEHVNGETNVGGS